MLRKFLNRITIGHIIVALAAFIITLTTCVARGESACQRRGYPTALVWPTKTYCVKQVNGTDVLAPLDSLERAR